MNTTESNSWGPEMSDTYCIRVSGHLNDRWSDWLGGLAICHQEDGTTVLVGPIVDQAALHGVIIRIRDLGLTLLSINRGVEPHSNASQGSSAGDATKT